MGESPTVVVYRAYSQWRTERGGGCGVQTPLRNSEDIGGVLDRMSKKSVSYGDTLPHTVVGVCGEFQRTGRFLQRGI